MSSRSTTISRRAAHASRVAHIRSPGLAELARGEKLLAPEIECLRRAAGAIHLKHHAPVAEQSVRFCPHKLLAIGVGQVHCQRRGL